MQSNAGHYLIVIGILLMVIGGILLMVIGFTMMR